MKKQSQRKKNEIEEALKQSQNMLWLVINNVPQQIFWKNTNSEFLGCNRNFAIALGFEDPEDIVGKTDYDFVSKELAEHFIEIDLKVIQDNHAFIT